jgi:hypothetical protein
MITRVCLFTLLIASFSLFHDSESYAAAPAVENLYIVNSNLNAHDANPGDGICAGFAGYCTLRAATQEANSDGTPSRIEFAFPMTISPTSFFGVGDHTVIDASDQWGGTWPSGSPGVTIHGDNFSNGLILIQGEYAAVRGIRFTGSSSMGIFVDGSKETIIGGTGPGQRNVFTLTHGSTGVLVGGGSTKIDIRGNYFGTWNGQIATYPSGMYGINLSWGDNLVRDNLIVGHTEAGIISWQQGHNLIMNNIIGANFDKSHAIPNKIGILLHHGSDENQIGPGNEISYNNQDGIFIDGPDNNLVWGNNIYSNGNHGINIIGAIDTRIGLYGENFIRGNTGHGINIYRGNNSQVLSNYICSNSQAGVYLEDTQNNTIGGPLVAQENLISDNGGPGIHLSTAANSNMVSGNIIGLGEIACPVGNRKHGVLIENGASDNRIGGLDPGKGNWIGNNDQSGIYITGSGTTGNVVEGNVIGAEPDWSQAAPNGHHGIGIYDGASGNWIGWFNTILASGWSGVVINNNSSNNVIWLNHIGTDGADINWGNSFYGVNIVNSPGNQIIGNGIHNNGTHAGEAGVRIQETGSVNNFISINSIHNNGGLGIELFNFGNSNQPAPTITSSSCSNVSGTACLGCIVEIFSDSADEGKIFEASVNADPSTGAFSWAGSPAGPILTATATKAALGPTSQFSAPYNIGICHSPPIAAFTYTPNKVYTCTSAAFDASSSSDIDDPVSALQVRWDWENDGTFDTGLSYQKTAQHRFNSAGVKTVRLEVQDTDGLTDATTRQVTVEACVDVYLPLVIH